jgi:hypothetical protein
MITQRIGRTRLAVALAAVIAAQWPAHAGELRSDDHESGLRPRDHGYGGARALGSLYRPHALAAHAPRPPYGADGTIHLVTSCADDGSPGTLRVATAAAASGDTIDMQPLDCTIFLSSALSVGVDDLDMEGPITGIVSLVGTNDAPVIVHTGSGTLQVNRLMVSGGTAGAGATAAAGGCIGSAGNLVLFESIVSTCVAEPPTGPAFGGGIYVAGDLMARYSTISGSARSLDNVAFGGAVFAGGRVELGYSTIIGGNAFSGPVGAADGPAYGGGIFALGSVSIANSTINDNSAHNVGGISAVGYGEHVSIVNSTISGNEADALIGGLYANGTLTLANSTVAFNHETISYVEPGYRAGAGVTLFYATMNLESTIISDNTVTTSSAIDLSGIGAVVSGASSLVVSSYGVMPPPDTILVSPGLAPLADNGGYSWTHALSPTSVAIDRGNNAGAYASDQRGAGYARVSGMAADIGAFELQDRSDAIFTDGFDPRF